MKYFFAIAALAASMAAGATVNGNGCQGNCAGGDTTNNYDQRNYNQGGSASAGAVGVGIGIGVGGAGGAGGQGGDAKAYGGAGGSVLGSGNSSVKNDNSNVGLNLQGQQQGQGQKQSASSDQSQSSSNTNNVSGYGGSANGNGVGNTTSIDIAAPVIPKPAANSAYVGDLPQLPQGSCRLFIGGGATSRDGSGTGMLPIGNDLLCTAGKKMEHMKQINVMFPGTFTKEDFKVVFCAIEDADKLAACAK